jgi:hypothetical protein
LGSQDVPVRPSHVNRRCRRKKDNP